MRKYLPILIALVLLGIGGYLVVMKKKANSMGIVENRVKPNIGSFERQKMCARPPQFLQKLKIPQPVIIDLSQKRFKGIALLYGKNFQKVLHPKQWEQYGHFGTYALSQAGDMYLAPIPYISILPATFNLQKKLYKIDSKTAKLSIFMDFEDILPSASNPYGLDAIAYDCEDKTLWVASIDKSDYQSQKGVIYHINPDTKEILQKVEGFDVLSMTIVKSEKGKYLLVGSARDNGLYAYTIDKGKFSTTPQKLLELPVSNQHIRKIKITDKNALELQGIPFSYALIAQTAKQDRTFYQADWDTDKSVWHLKHQIK
jgi:hypothetical protein